MWYTGAISVNLGFAEFCIASDKDIQEMLGSLLQELNEFGSQEWAGS